MILLLKRWKALPKKRRNHMLGRAVNNLERNLSKWANAVKSSYDHIKDELLRGQSKQKQACKEMINKTINDQKRMWVHHKKLWRFALGQQI